jgi:flagellar hook-length control protein FliK
MNVNLLTMDNLFAGNLSPCQAQSKPVAPKLASHFDPNTAGSTTSVSIPNITTTDNTVARAQAEPLNTLAQNVGHEFREIMMTKTAQKDQDSPKLKEQNSPFVTVVQIDSAQPVLPQVFIAAVLGEEAITKINKPTAIKPETQPASLITTPKVYESAETAMPTTIKLDQLVSVKSQAGKEEPQLAVEQSQIGPKGLSSNSSDDSVLTSTANAAAKNGDQVLVETAVATEAVPEQQSGKEPMPDALAGNSKMAVASQKTGIADDSTVYNGPETALLDGNDSMPQAFANSSKMTTADGKSPILNTGAVSPGQKTTVLNDSFLGLQGKSFDKGQKASVVPEKSALSAEKPAPILNTGAVSPGQKTTVLNDSFLGLQGKSFDKGQKDSVVPEKSPLSAEEPADNEVSLSQQGKMFTELAGAGVNGRKQADNLSGELLGQKLNLTYVQVSTGQTKNYSSSTSDGGSKSNFEQILTHNNAQIPIVERFSEAPAQAAVKTAGNTSSGDAFESISEQILGSVRSSLHQADRQIVIRLNPPELGKVFIRFQEQEDQITGLLEVSKIQTRYEIEQVLPQIIRTLQNSGIQIKRFDVVLTDQSDQQAYKDQSMQDGSFQQHSFTEGDNSHNKSANQWFANAHSQDIPELQNVFITDSSIDMLV